MDLANLAFFVVGLALGLFQLWQNQKYFQAQQQDKFNQIATQISEMKSRLVLISEAVSERASAREDRLLSIATQRSAVQSVAETAVEEAAEAQAEQRIEQLRSELRGEINELAKRLGEADTKVADAVQNFEVIVERAIRETRSAEVEARETVDNERIKKFVLEVFEADREQSSNELAKLGIPASMLLRMLHRRDIDPAVGTDVIAEMEREGLVRTRVDDYGDKIVALPDD